MSTSVPTAGDRRFVDSAEWPGWPVRFALMELDGSYWLTLSCVGRQEFSESAPRLARCRVFGKPF